MYAKSFLFVCLLFVHEAHASLKLNMYPTITLNSDPPASTSRVLACTVTAICVVQGLRLRIYACWESTLPIQPLPRSLVLSTVNQPGRELFTLAWDYTFLSAEDPAQPPNTQDKTVRFEDKLCSLLPRTPGLLFFVSLKRKHSHDQLSLHLPPPLISSACILSIYLQDTLPLGLHNQVASPQAFGKVYHRWNRDTEEDKTEKQRTTQRLICSRVRRESGLKSNACMRELCIKW